MNLVRIHILNNRRDMEESHGLLPMPDSYALPVPPEMPPDYMADPDGIRQRAKDALAAAASLSETVGNGADLGLRAERRQLQTLLSKAELSGRELVDMRRIANGLLYKANGRLGVAKA